MSTSADLSSQVLFIGPDDKYGGIGAVLRIYEKHIPNFKFVSTYPQDPRVSRTLYFVLALFRIIKKLITDSDISIIHLHAASKGSFIRKSIVVLLGKLSKKKVVLHIHGGSFKDFYNSAGFFRPYIAWIFRASDQIICLSEDWLLYFTQVFPQAKTAVLYNPIEQAEFINKKFDPSRIHLLFMGKVCYEKGIFDLLEFIVYNNELLGDRFCFHIAGNGDTAMLHTIMLHPLLKDKVVYHGWLDQSQKNTLLSGCDIFILPSHFEGLPMSILEAMSFAKPIIATDVGGIPSLVSPGENGWLIDPHQLGHLKDVFRTVIADRTILKYYGDNSLHKSKKYHVSEVLTSLRHIYQDVL